MESVLHTKMRRTVAAACGICALAVVGCGSNDDYKNADRPPSPITVTAFISDTAVSVSPAKFGAGPVNLIITNQSGSAQRVTFETGGDAAGFRQQTGPINPGAPATLKADVPKGQAVVKVNGAGIRSAKVTVSAERTTAQNELLQP